MGEVERPQGREDRDDMDQRRAAVLGRSGAPSERQVPDVGSERTAPDDPDRDRRDAILGRQRNAGQERDAAGSERDQGQRESILGRGRDTGQERGQSRDHDRDRDRERER